MLFKGYGAKVGLGNMRVKAENRMVTGNGGFLGYVGTFHSPKLGKFYMAAINKNELVKIVTYNGKIYVINYPHSLLEDRINE